MKPTEFRNHPRPLCLVITASLGMAFGAGVACDRPASERKPLSNAGSHQSENLQTSTFVDNQEGIYASEAQAPSSSAPNLNRSETVVAEKIARKQSSKGKSARNPAKRYREWYSDRAGDDGVFSFDEVLQAKKHIEQMPQLGLGSEEQAARDAGIWNWEWLGPGNIGGRIRSILIHPTNPNRMWVGSVGGGIWTTINAGTSWSPVDDFLPTLAVSTMVMDPDNSNNLYAGTGEGFYNFDALPGAGVFKSTDGGLTWNQLPDTASWTYVNRLAIDPTDGQHLLAATNNGIYLTTDGGVSWSQELFIRTLDVKFHPTDGMQAVSGSATGSIRYTTDGGSSWSVSTFVGDPANTEVRIAFSADGDSDHDDVLQVDATTGISPGDPIRVGTGGNAETVVVQNVVDADTLVVEDMVFAHGVNEPVATQRTGRVELAYAPSVPGLVYASMDVSRGTIWVSLDGGATFGVMNNTDDDYLGGQGWYDNVIWVLPDDATQVIVGGIDLWRVNLGSIWRISRWQDYHTGLSAHADQHAIVAHPGYNGTSNRMVFFGNDGGIQRALDILTVSQTSGWDNLAHNLGITQFYGGAASPDGAIIVGGSQDNDTLRYLPAGGLQGWYQAQYGDGGYCAIDYSSPSSPIIYAEYVDLSIEKSVDGGNTYFGATNGLTDAGNNGANARFIAPFSMSAANPSVLYAGGTSIWRSSNSAGSWSSVRSPLGTASKCSSIDVAGTTGNIVWVGYENGTLSRTSDSGANWSNVDGNGATPLPNRVVTDIAINPANTNEVFVTFAGYLPNNVWYTSDNGANWEQRTGAVPNDLPSLQVNSIRIHPTETNWVYIGTDLGVFASEDRGLTWSVTPRFTGSEGPVNTEVAELFWQGDYLVAATHGRGMFRVRPRITVYIDLLNTGPEDGSLGNPFDTIAEGIDAAGHGTNIMIRTSTYDEPGTTTFFKRGLVQATNGTVVIR